MIGLLTFIAQVTSPETVPLSFGWLLLKTLLAMGVVVFLAIVSLRYLLPRLYGRRLGKGTHIRILERFGLEPRKGLYIVQVGKKTILLGTSDHQVNKLLDLDPQDLKREETTLS